MNQLVPLAAAGSRALVVAVGEHASHRFFEFFTAQIRNPNTRPAYARRAPAVRGRVASAGCMAPVAGLRGAIGTLLNTAHALPRLLHRVRILRN
jgi:hypothetical protein